MNADFQKFSLLSQTVSGMVEHLLIVRFWN